ncbi:recombinase family protein [Paenibacillus rhizophilus]|uniref:Recombinase family protein n=1 Tax=Paenibacillus rhizophilus TaxID=1850366 RepID=A0A3N9P3R1_9BACL|nr:recombinase family protein [Paenibacillus rhizophilus]RQW10379.1 recombinase family protein [Paenibacillus rhizophilus]
MKAAIYIRVSTDEQANEGFSIDAQKRRLLAYADSQDWEVTEVYIDDGWSAKDLKRPEMQRMIGDVKQKLFDVVLVYKLDRMTRSSNDCDHLLKMFEAHSVKFQSCTESFETRTATGRLFIRLVADIAQWERENTAERVRFGMEQMVMEGRRPGGPVPFGYDKSGKLVEEEAAQIRLLRRFYMEGDGIKAIAIKLNGMGKYRRGFKWSAFPVWYILDNPYYAGKLRYGTKKSNGKYASRKKEGVVDLIVQESDNEKLFTWEEYEEHKAEMHRRSFDGYSKSREYWFSGVLICGKCGSKMSGRYHQNKRKDGSYNKITSYICANRQTGKGCTMPMFRQELVEKLLMEWIEGKLTIDHNVIREISVTAEEDPNESLRDDLNKELQKVRERRKKWQRMYADDLISQDELREHNADEKANEDIIMAELEKMPEMSSESLTAPSDIIYDLPELWPLMEDKDKHDLILDIFKEIKLYTPVDKAHGKKGKFIPASIESVVFN